MHKTTMNTNLQNNNVTINTDNLVKLLDCGRSTAVRIGLSAGAKIKIGKRVLWNIEKIETYLDSLSTTLDRG